MKKIILFTGSMALALNTSTGFLLSSYGQFVAGVLVRPELADNYGILLIAALMLVDICVCFIINHFIKYA